MISREEITKGKEVPAEYEANLAELLRKANLLRTAWAKAMTITSGYRTMEDHLRIYKEKNITDKSKIPMKSKHLYCKAVDISDPDGKLMVWAKANVSLLTEIGLWCEDRTQGWLHIQIEPPASGNRFYMP